MLAFSCLLGPYLRGLVEAEKYTVTQFPERAEAPEGLFVLLPAQPCSRGALPPSRCSGPLQRERCGQRGADAGALVPCVLLLQLGSGDVCCETRAKAGRWHLEEGNAAVVCSGLPEGQRGGLQGS